LPGQAQYRIAHTLPHQAVSSALSDLESKALSKLKKMRKKAKKVAGRFQALLFSLASIEPALNCLNNLGWQFCFC
jgi:hypothetical protein